MTREFTASNSAPPLASSIDELQSDGEVQHALGVIERAWSRHRYSYHFRWLGIPIIQLPQDIVALQEIIWQTQPECIIETGIGHGGSLLFYASMLRLLGNNGIVVGVEIDFRDQNRAALAAHPLASSIHIIDGSSTAPASLTQIRALAENKRTMVVLDSNHTHEHVLNELQLYTPLVTMGGYCCVMDTIVERMPDDMYTDRPWARGNNPATAVSAFLAQSKDFLIDESFDRKLGLSMAPQGYLRRIAP